MTQDPTKNPAFDAALQSKEERPNAVITDMARGQYPTFASTDDRRVGNNPVTERTSGSIAGGAFRAKFRTLSDDEKDMVDRIKGMGEDMYRLLAEIGGTDPTSDKLASPNLMLAFRSLEDAVSRAVKHVTA